MDTKRDPLIVRRPNFRWAVFATYVVVFVFLSVTLTGNLFTPQPTLTRSYVHD